MSKRARDVLWVGFALFAMFFGAGNLIFPPLMGLLSGADWGAALAGFLITGVGMPLVGIMAAARAGGTVEHLAGRVSPWFAKIFSITVILAIGPLLAIPRTAAATFEMGIRPNLPETTPVISSIVFFAITLFFTLNRSTVVEKIGKFLTPFLLFTLALIIVRGIVAPLGRVPEAGLEGPFGKGFREGYQTMDALASVVFAGIVIGALAFKGYESVADQVKLTSVAGLIAAAGLGLVYGGLMYLGATAATQYPADVERTDLLIGIARGLLGNNGKVALGLAVSLACLTTSIGLTATVGEYFSKLSKGRAGYKTICIGTCVFSGVFATVGVTRIVTIAVPLLVLLYPIAIVLVLLAMMGGKAKSRAVYTGAVVGAFATSIFEALGTAGLPVAAADGWIAAIPLANAGFPWIVPAILGALAGAVLSRVRRRWGLSAEPL